MYFYSFFSVISVCIIAWLNKLEKFWIVEYNLAQTYLLTWLFLFIHSLGSKKQLILQPQ